MSRAGRSLVALSVVLSLGGGPAAGQTVDQAVGRPAPTQERVDGHRIVHRVVWDAEGRYGIEIKSARRNGTRPHTIFTQEKGSVDELTLDRRGAYVALAPYRNTAPKQGGTGPHGRLVVVAVRGGRSWDVLENTRPFAAVNGIGWSPSGLRLAFEGTIRVGQRYRHYLWSVHSDGTHLKRLVRRGPLASTSLAWTKRGIIYQAGANVLLLQGSRSRVLVPDGRNPRISGNGHWLVVDRIIGAEASIWRCHADGSALEKVSDYQHPTLGRLTNLTPTYDGHRLLAFTSRPGNRQRTIVFDAGSDPANSYRVLHFVGRGYGATWN